MPSPIPGRYDILPYEEDWSYLKDTRLRSDWLDPIKYIAFGHDKQNWLSVGGEVRCVYEKVQNDNWTAEPFGLQSFGLQRFLAHADVHLHPNLRIFIELESGIEQGRQGGPRPIDEKRFDFLNAFVEIHGTGHGRKRLLRIGKQELQFGSGRLISVREGPNVRQGFFGVRLDDTIGKWQLTAFAVRPSADNAGAFDDGPIGSVGLWGINANRQWQHSESYSVNTYYYGLDRKLATFNLGTAHEVRQTFGGQFVADLPSDPGNRSVVPHLDVEATLQAGSFGDVGIHAWGIASEFGVALPHMVFRPRVGLRADATSGNIAGARRLGTFNSIFPVGDYFGVLADTGPGPANSRDLHPTVVVFLPRQITVTPDWLIYWRESLSDGLYDVPGSLLVPTGTSRARFVGHQPGIGMRWQVDTHTYLTGSYGAFFAGPFLRESNHTKNLNYLTISVGYKF